MSIARRLSPALRRLRDARRLRWAAPIVVAGALILLLALLTWPLVFSDATFNEDWLNHLWYVWHQSEFIRANLHPSFFVDYSGGVFYPLFAFYGGTLYALTGILSLVLGNAPLDAYVLTYLLGFAAAYAGWYWIARLFGVGRWLAAAPGTLFVTSAGYLTTVYGLGDWPEFLAVSIMPALIASTLAVLRAERVALAPAIALAASSFLFFGSHLLTVIWGSTALVLTSLALVALVPDVRSALRWRNALCVLALVAPAALVSAWFLLPAAAYESKTVIAHSYPIFRNLLRHDMYTVAAHNLFTFSRSPAPGSRVTTALPILAIVWVVVGVALHWREHRRDAWMRIVLVLGGATLAMAIVMTHAEIILALPRLYATVQFSLRLESYVLLGISGAVMATLVLNRNGGRASRALTVALVPVLAVSIVGAAQQVSAHPAGRSRSIALSSYLQPIYEQEGLIDYVDDYLPYIKRRLPKLSIPATAIRDDRVSVHVGRPAGTRLDTNLRAGPELVDIAGARIVGGDPEADDVVELLPGGGSHRGANGRARGYVSHIEISSAGGGAISAGRTLSLLALAVLALELAVLAMPSRLRTRIADATVALAPRAGHGRDDEER